MITNVTRCQLAFPLDDDASFATSSDPRSSCSMSLSIISSSDDRFHVSDSAADSEVRDISQCRRRLARPAFVRVVVSPHRVLWLLLRRHADGRKKWCARSFFDRTDRDYAKAPPLLHATTRSFGPPARPPHEARR
mmetsp:Transcript_23706/g.76158  ORF Transcript_23706/g.76158 Transcript_23706/m.76158 type:complete len:135 (-) Transcript_23706:942-1346(-)